MTNKLEKISFIILLITIILAPLVFIPSTYASLDMIKTTTITFGVLLSAVLYFISIIKSRDLYISKHPLFLISSGIIISLIVSTIISSNTLRSFFGQGFETGTTSFILAMFLSALLIVYTTSKQKERVTYVLGAITIPFILISLFHIARLFGGANFLSLGILNSPISTILGKWSDLAVFSLVAFIFYYLALRTFKLKKIFKFSIIALLLVSAFIIFIVNSTLISFVFALAIASILAYEMYIYPEVSTGIKGFVKKIPVVTLIILILSIVSFWKGPMLSNSLITKFNVQNSELILPWQLTLDVAADTIKESPLFGAGPNRFGSQYLKFKPFIINTTPFWNTEFASGFSLISTFVVTQGLTGLILWLLLIIAIFYTGLKSIKFIKDKDELTKFLIASTFLSSASLWIISLIYIPSQTGLFMTFILTSLFVSVLVNNNQISFTNINNENSLLSKFTPILVLVILAICVLWLASFTKKTISIIYFQRGISSLNQTGNQGIEKAESLFKKALYLDKNDTYYQALTEISIVKINTIAQTIQAEVAKTGGAPNQESVKKITSLIEEAMQYSKSAIAVDQGNYYNYLSQARISSVALTLQIPGAYETAKAAYTDALKYNPFDPSLYLSLARIEASQNKIAEAKKYIGNSLQLKQDYLDAIFLLSQIQISQNQIKEAITSVQVASQINPNNPVIFFQLGFLHYNDKNYQAAIDSLSQALKLDSRYANAQYFLGLAYARINNIPDALIQFESLAISNPDNQEVKVILQNLRKGRLPFTDVKPPIDNKPEKRNSLPIKEKTTKNIRN